MAQRQIYSHSLYNVQNYTVQFLLLLVLLFLISTTWLVQSFTVHSSSQSINNTLSRSWTSQNYGKQLTDDEIIQHTLLYLENNGNNKNNNDINDLKLQQQDVLLKKPELENKTFSKSQLPSYKPSSGVNPFIPHYVQQRFDLWQHETAQYNLQQSQNDSKDNDNNDIEKGHDFFEQQEQSHIGSLDSTFNTYNNNNNDNKPSNIINFNPIISSHYNKQPRGRGKKNNNNNIDIIIDNTDPYFGESPLLLQQDNNVNDLRSRVNHLVMSAIPTSEHSRRSYIRGYIDCYEDISDPEPDSDDSICMKPNLSFSITWFDTSTVANIPRFWAQAFVAGTKIGTYNIDNDNNIPKELHPPAVFKLYEQHQADWTTFKEKARSFKRIHLLMEFLWNPSMILTRQSINFYLGYDRAQLGSGTLQILSYTPFPNMKVSPKIRRDGTLPEAALFDISLLGAAFQQSNLENPYIPYSDYDVAWQYYIPNIPISFTHIYMKHFGAIQYEYTFQEEMYPQNDTRIHPRCVINGLIAILQPVFADATTGDLFVGYFLHTQMESNVDKPIIFHKGTDLVMQCHGFRNVTTNENVAYGISIQIIPSNLPVVSYPGEPGQGTLNDRLIYTHIFKPPYNDKGMVPYQHKFQFFSLSSIDRPKYILSPQGEMVWSGNRPQPLTNQNQCVTLYMRQYDITSLETDILGSLPFQLTLEQANPHSFLWGYWSLIKQEQQQLYDSTQVLQSAKLQPISINEISKTYHDDKQNPQYLHRNDRIYFNNITLSLPWPFHPTFNQSVTLYVHVAVALSCNDKSKSIPQNDQTVEIITASSTTSSLALFYEQPVRNADRKPASFQLLHVAAFSPYRTIKEMEIKTHVNRINLLDEKYRSRYYEQDLRLYRYRYKFSIRLTKVPDSAPFWFEKDNIYPYPIKDLTTTNTNTTTFSNNSTGSNNNINDDQGKIIKNEPWRILSVIIPSEIFAFHGEYRECYILTQGGWAWDHVIPYKMLPATGEKLMPIQSGEQVPRLFFNYTFNSKINQDGTQRIPVNDYVKDPFTPEYTLTCLDVFLINSTEIDFYPFDWDHHKHFKPELYPNKPLIPNNPKDIPILLQFSHYVVPQNITNYYLSATMIEFDKLHFDKYKTPGVVIAWLILFIVLIMSFVWCYSTSDTAIQSQTHRSRNINTTTGNNNKNNQTYTIRQRFTTDRYPRQRQQQYGYQPPTIIK